MKLKRRILYLGFVQFLISRLIALYINFVYLTSKTKFHNIEHLEKAQGKYKNIIFTFWHGRELMTTRYLRDMGQMYSIVSHHKDGNLATEIISCFGSTMIRGSSTKGGSKVIREVIKTFKHPNRHLCITPDGPRGPRMRVQGAVIDLARLTGAAILPLSISCKRCKFLPSWDKFMIPFPFNKISVSFAEPIEIAKNLTPDAVAKHKANLEKCLNEMTFSLDDENSIVRIEPADIDKTS